MVETIRGFEGFDGFMASSQERVEGVEVYEVTPLSPPLLLPLLLTTASYIGCQHISTSGGTLLWDNRRLIGRSLIVLARKVQNNRD